MQNEVEKQFNTTTSSVTGSPVAQPALSFEEKVVIDGRSVHVANVVFILKNKFLYFFKYI